MPDKKTKYEIEQEKKEKKREKIEAARKAKRESELQKGENAVQRFFHSEEGENVAGVLKQVGRYVALTVVAYLYWAFLLFMASLMLISIWGPKYTDILLYSGLLTVITVGLYALNQFRTRKK